MFYLYVTAQSSPGSMTLIYPRSTAYGSSGLIIIISLYFRVALFSGSVVRSCSVHGCKAHDTDMFLVAGPGVVYSLTQVQTGNSVFIASVARWISADYSFIFACVMSDLP